VVKQTLGPVVTCALIGLLVAWLARPYFHETEKRFTKALAAKTVGVYRRLNSKYRRQVKRQESKINRALDKASSKIERNIEIQVRRLTKTMRGQGDGGRATPAAAYATLVRFRLALPSARMKHVFRTLLVACLDTR
jgi:hypothetical protein